MPGNRQPRGPNSATRWLPLRETRRWSPGTSTASTWSAGHGREGARPRSSGGCVTSMNWTRSFEGMPGGLCTRPAPPSSSGCEAPPPEAERPLVSTSLRSWSCLARISGVSCWLRSGDVCPPGPGQAGDEARLDRVRGVDHDDRDRLSWPRWAAEAPPPGRRRRSQSTWVPHELGDQLRQKRSRWPSAQRYSKRTFLPSGVTQPLVARPRPAAAICDRLPARVVGHQQPDGAKLLACVCAKVALGHGHGGGRPIPTGNAAPCPSSSHLLSARKD